MRNQKAKDGRILPIILVCLVVFGLGGYYLGKQPSQPPIKQPTQMIPVLTTLSDLTANWKTYNFKEIGLTFKAPPDLSVKGEAITNSNTGVLTGFTLYVQNYDTYPPAGSGKIFYQLYGLYQVGNYTQKDIEAHKEDFELSTIENVMVDGFLGIRGQYKGERNRYATLFIKDNAMFALLTADPIPENEALSNQIISTFRFN